MNPLERSYRRAEVVTAHWARSFHFASRFLPRTKRRSVFALYDFCRHADNLVDARGARSVAAVRTDLEQLRLLIIALHAGQPCTDVRWLALADTLGRYEVPLAPLLGLLEGVARDLDPVAMPDFAALQDYCGLVAGGVGLMLGPILGAPPGTLRGSGTRLGVAMQLTNVLRDVGEDLAAGRLYLPADELAEFGLSPRLLERREVTPAFRRFMQWQIARARRWFADGGLVVPLFPDDGSRMTVRLMQLTYSGILDAIERNGYDVFNRRAFVSAPRKALVLGRALWSERNARLTQPVRRTV